LVDGHHARKLRKEGEVIHVITDRIGDLSAELRQVGERGGPALRVPHSRADEMHEDGGPDPRGIIATHAEEDTIPTCASTATRASASRPHLR